MSDKSKVWCGENVVLVWDSKERSYTQNDTRKQKQNIS